MWPREIEADFQREYRLDIASWHRGDITSRRALTLIDQLSDDSGYKREFERDGNWPVWQQMLKDLHNETALHRAGLYAGGDNAYDPRIYLDPLEVWERVEAAMAENEFHDKAESELHESLGWS